MKRLLPTFYCILFFIINVQSQNIQKLDEKGGYMDIKVGEPISGILDKVQKDEEANNMYLVKNVYEYEIENHKIDKIIIIVSNDDKKTIEHFTLMFVDRIDELLSDFRDKSLSLDNRKKALEEAKKLQEKGSEYDFYKKLFIDAFGKPNDDENKLDVWNGNKIRLMCSKSSKTGLINFSKVLSKEELKKIKDKKAAEATNKF